MKPLRLDTHECQIRAPARHPIRRLRRGRRPTGPLAPARVVVERHERAVGREIGAVLVARGERAVEPVKRIVGAASPRRDLGEPVGHARLGAKALIESQGE